MRYSSLEFLDGSGGENEVEKVPRLGSQDAGDGDPECDTGFVLRRWTYIGARYRTAGVGDGAGAM